MPSSLPSLLWPSTSFLVSLYTLYVYVNDIGSVMDVLVLFEEKRKRSEEEKKAHTNDSMKEE